MFYVLREAPATGPGVPALILSLHEQRDTPAVVTESYPNLAAVAAAYPQLIWSLLGAGGAAGVLCIAEDPN